MRFKNNVGPQVRRRRYALGWSQSVLAAKLQIAGFDISRSGVSKIEARLSYVDDKALLYLAEVSEGAGSGTFPAANARQSDIRLHRETGDDAILMRRGCNDCTRDLYPLAPKRSKKQLIRAKGRASEIVTSD